MEFRIRFCGEILLSLCFFLDLAAGVVCFAVVVDYWACANWGQKKKKKKMKTSAHSGTNFLVARPTNATAIIESEPKTGPFLASPAPNSVATPHFPVSSTTTSKFRPHPETAQTNPASNHAKPCQFTPIHYLSLAHFGPAALL